jgi:cell division septal protein FtsQ
MYDLFGICFGLFRALVTKSPIAMKKYLLLGYLWVFTSLILYAQAPNDITADPSATVDETFAVTFTDGSAWRTGITQIKIGTDIIDSGAYDTTKVDSIIFNPSASVLLQSAGTITLTIESAEGNATVDQTIDHGAAAAIVITQEPSAPSVNGGALGANPAVKLQDQYGNDCTNDNSSSVGVAAHAASWTLGGTTPLTVASGAIAFNNLTATSTDPVTGAYIVFSSGSLPTVNSATFTIPGTTPNLTAASGATVDNDFNIELDSDDSNWRTAITEISFGTDILPSGAYDVTKSDTIILKPSQSVFLQTVATKDVTIKATNYPDAVVSQTIDHGAATKFTITTQPGAPASNGGQLATQPVLQLKDQYDNNCDTDDATQVNASATGNGTWTLGGTLPQTASGGIVNYSGLTASSNVEVTAATITFDLGGGSFTQESGSFLLSLNSPPGLSANGSATVDVSFAVSFVDNADWESKISEVSYNSTTLSSGTDYDIDESGNTITLKPGGGNSVLQTAGTADLVMKADGYDDTSVSQTIGHGSATQILMVTQPAAPSVNGGQLATQPTIKLQDQYNNDCSTDNSTNVSVAKGDTGNWTLGGDLSLNVSSGSLAFTNLTASSNETITGAYLTFSSSGLTGVDSDTFNLGLNSPPSNLAAAGSADVDGNFTITFTDVDGWQSKISSITYDGVSVDAGAYDTSTSGQITFTPSLSTALQSAKTADFLFVSDGFSDASLSQTIGHGAANKLSITTQPGSPAANGDPLNPQPIMEVLDQYDNLCSSDGSRTITAAKADAGNWTLGGTLDQNANSGSLIFSGLTASSNEEITNASINFTSTGLTGVTSTDFSIGLNTPPTLTAALGATVDGAFEISYDDDVNWESNITSVTFDGSNVPSLAYTINSTTNKITFDPADDAVLQTAKTGDIVISVDGYGNASVSQEIGHGAETKLVVTTQPVAPANNGDDFQNQPVVEVQDQYNNVCTSNSSLSITASENDPAAWDLQGTLSGAVSSGSLSYSDLSASSTDVVTGAFIVFSATGVTGTNSSTFDLGLNSPPDLTAASGATVDNSFVITFADSNSWQSKITSITYNGNTVDAAAYNVSVADQITFDPSQSTALQTAGTADFIISASGFNNKTLSQEIGHGVPASIYIVTQPTAPTQNGGLLATQPTIGSKDQYGNNCTGDNATAISVAKGDSGDWSLGGSPNQTLVSGEFTYTDLSATSNEAVTGAYLTFTSGSFAAVDSNPFDIPVNGTPALTEATVATVDNDFFISFTEDAAWRGNISSIQYGSDVLPSASYDTSVAGRITFDPSQSSFLQVAGTKTITIVSSGYANAEIDQEIGHGNATDLFISTQPIGPSSNGEALATQPVIQIHDQYGNVVTSDDTSNLTATSSGGTWTLGGSVDLTASAGEFTFTDLTASSSAEVTDATITFSTFALSDVISNTFTVPALDASPSLLASSSATVDNTFEITFVGNSAWQLSIDSIHYDGNLISEPAYDKTQAEKIIFDPSQDTDLQVSGTANIEVFAQGYETASVSQEIKHGAASEIVIALQPAAPARNGEELATQPGVTLRDQYGNDCTTENSIEITASKGDANDWTLGGTVVKTVANGSASYTDLTASAPGPVTGAFISFSATDLSTVNSSTFDIPDLDAGPALTAASGATVDNDFEITFTDNADWRTNITEVRYGTNVLPTAAYDASIAGKITIKPAESANLQLAANEYIYITSTSYLLDSVQQEIGHGVATSIVITTQPMGPDTNGDLLMTQPVVKLQDQYQNDCTNDNSTTVEANASGGSWNLEGTASLMVTNGVASYTDLTAGSTDMVSDATITFSGTGLTNAESNSFLIPAPLFAPSLIASATATVDSLFDITFAENAEWQGKIDSVFYGGNLLVDTAYDKSQAGKIVLDPSVDAALQEAATKQVIVYARGYQDATVDQEIKHGKPDSLIIETQPTAPLVNGGELDLQPKISLLDQYNNSCSTENAYEVLVSRGDASNWTLGGDTLQAVNNGVINYRELTASSPNAVTGAYLTFSGVEITAVNSDPFDIPPLKNPPNLTSQFNATVDADFEIGYVDFDGDWRSEITMITYAGDTLPTSAYTINNDNIVFKVSEEELLQKAGTFDIVVKAFGYSDASVEQDVEHGVAASMQITQHPLAPPANGDLLEQQPILEIYDQYSNLCDSDNESLVIASRNDDGDWNLAGTIERTVENGVVNYDDLSAYSTAPVTGAVIQFDSEGLDAVTANAFDIPDVSTPPVLTAAVDATVDNPFKITFSEDAVWRNRINVITVNDSVLVEESYNFSQAGELELIPSASEFLQKSGSFEIIVQSRGFAHDTVQQDIQHGVADSILVLTQPVGPDVNGELFAKQPELKLADQYLNDCTTDNSTQVSVEKFDNKAWELSGTLEIQSVDGEVLFTDLVATSEIAIDSAYLQFSFAGDSVVSELFTIPVPIIELIAAENATVDNEFVIQASDNASWRDSISSIHFAGETLVDTAYLVEAGQITFYPEKDSTLYIARTDTIVVVANGYADAKIEQKIGHGVATEMLLVDQPIGPENNGDTLAQQPKLQLRDQYENNCVADNATQVLTNKYSDPDNDNSGLWDLSGTKTITALEGIVQFTNLSTTSEDEVIGARLLFTSDGLPNVVSDSFNIVRPPAPIITPAANANVDEMFTVTFTENTTWRNKIFDIRYGIRSLEGKYDISVPGQITFDPSVTSILQKYGVDSMYVYSGLYDTTRFEQPIHHGKSKYLVVEKEPSPPVNNGGQFIRQPQLTLQDQYRNTCDTDSETPVTVRKADNENWTLGGTLMQVALNGVVKFTDLTATSEMEVLGARMEFEGTGLISKISSTFTIPEPKTNRAGEASANPELVCYGSKSNITLVGFDGNIQWQIYNEFDDIYEDLAGENAELLVSHEIVKNERYRAKVTKAGFSDQYSNAVSVSPMEPPVADFTFEIDHNQVQFTNLSENATSILWDFGDGILSSEFEPSHSFVLDNVNGTGYLVTLTASNEACPDSEKSEQIFILTGINDLIAESGVVVYPNPNRGEFFVEVSASDKEGLLRIFNSSGSVVLSKEITRNFKSDRLEFDLQNLPGGLYFLSIQYPDKMLRTKLVITK